MIQVNGFKNIPPRETYNFVREENEKIKNEQLAIIQQGALKQTQDQKKLDITA